MIVTGLVAAVGALGLLVILASPNRTGFALGLIVATNGAAVLHARSGVPAFLLPMAALAVAAGVLRFLRSPDGFRPPRTWVPAATIGVVAAIVLSAAIGPFVSIDPDSSAASVALLIDHMVIVAAIAIVASRAAGLRSVLVGLATGGALMATLTNLQRLTGTRGSTARGFGAWNQEVLGGTGDALRAAGPFKDDPNAYAQYLVVTGAIAVGLALTARADRARWRVYLAWSAVASIVLAVVQTASRGGLIAVGVVAIVAMLLERFEPRRLGAVALGGIVLLLSPIGIGDRLGTLTTTSPTTADSGLRGRASEMLAAVDMFVDHPVAGVGYGTYNDRYLDYSQQLGIDARFEERSAHSLPLEIAAEQGLIGLTIWLGFAALAVFVLVRLRRLRSDLGVPPLLALVGFGTTALFLHDVHPRLMWTLVGLVVGAALIVDRGRRAVEGPSVDSDRPIRVAMVIQGYVPAVGGAERQLANLMPLLYQRGIDPIVVTRSMPGRRRHDMVDGIPVARLPTFGPKPLRSLMFVVQARATLERFDPDVVHAFDTLTPSSIALGHQARHGTPVVTKILRSGELGDLHRLAQKPFGAYRRARLLRHVDAFVAISSEIDDELADLGVALERRRVIPNGVDTDRFKPPRHGVLAHGDLAPLTVIATGRLAPEKRLVELAERWHRVTDRCPDTRLMIIGDGPEYGRLAAFEHVVLTGSRADVANLLRGADVYVSASRAEGLSNSLLEAMATGLPCVVTDVGGVRDVITTPSQGEVVPADDLDGLVDAIADLVENLPHRRAMRRASRRRVMRHYGLERTADDLADLYAELAGVVVVPERVTESAPEHEEVRV